MVKVPCYHFPAVLKSPADSPVHYLFTLTGVKRHEKQLFDRHATPAGEWSSKVLIKKMGQPLASAGGFAYV